MFHLISTGKNNYQVAQVILERNPTLGQHHISPEVLRIAGYMHDFGKMGYGVKELGLDYAEDWHSLTSALAVLEQGDEWGIVRGGFLLQRYQFLQQVARCIPSDLTTLEEGGPNFPETAKYKITPKFVSEVDFLNLKLSAPIDSLTPPTGPLSFQQLTTPKTLEQKIAVWGDLVNLEGEQISVEDRFAEIVKRRGEYAEKAKVAGKQAETKYHTEHAKIIASPEFRARIFPVIEFIDQLAGRTEPEKWLNCQLEMAKGDTENFEYHVRLPEGFEHNPTIKSDGRSFRDGEWLPHRQGNWSKPD